jgi:hypothetical protein
MGDAPERRSQQQFGRADPSTTERPAPALLRFQQAGLVGLGNSRQEPEPVGLGIGAGIPQLTVTSPTKKKAEFPLPFVCAAPAIT